MATPKLKFYKYNVGGKTFYDLSPDKPAGQQEVIDPNELKQAEQFYQTNINDPRSLGLADRGGAETAGMQQRLNDYRSGISSQFVLNDQGTLAEPGQVASQKAQQDALASGKDIMIGGTSEAPLTAPKGTPDPKTVTYEQSLAGPAGQIPGVQPSAPVRGSGTYVEDLAKSKDAPLGSTERTNYLLQEASKQTGLPAQTFGTGAQPITPGATPTTPTTPVPTTPAVSGTSATPRAEKAKQEIEQYKQMLNTGLTEPVQFNSLAKFDELRKSQGVVQDEAELQALQQEALLAKQELRKLSATAGQGVSEGGRIGIMSEAQRNLNFLLEGLSIREQGIVARLNNKNAYISTVLNLGQSDYNTARNEYEFEYNKNLKAIGLMNDELDDQKKDALTGLTTITGLLADKGVDLSTLDANTKAQIDSLSLQAGIPQGLIQSVISIAPKDKVQTVNERTDASGNNYWDILKVRPDGSFYTQQVFRGKERVPGTGGGGSSGVGGITKPIVKFTATEQKNYEAFKSEIPTYANKQTALDDLVANKTTIIQKIGQAGYDLLEKNIEEYFKQSSPFPTIGGQTGPFSIDEISKFLYK